MFYLLAVVGAIAVTSVWLLVRRNRQNHRRQEEESVRLRVPAWYGRVLTYHKKSIHLMEKWDDRQTLCGNFFDGDKKRPIQKPYVDWLEKDICTDCWIKLTGDPTFDLKKIEKVETSDVEDEIGIIFDDTNETKPPPPPPPLTWERN